ncbi:hypothetical protein MRX96_001232 [Rhipicephalus microplus]
MAEQSPPFSATPLERPSRSLVPTSSHRRSASVACTRVLWNLISSAKAVRLHHEQAQKLCRVVSEKPTSLRLPVLAADVETTARGLTSSAASSPTTSTTASSTAVAAHHTAQLEDAGSILCVNVTVPQNVPLPLDEEPDIADMDTTSTRKRSRPSESGSDDEGGSRKMHAVAPERATVACLTPTSNDAVAHEDAVTHATDEISQSEFQTVLSKSKKRRQRASTSQGPAAHTGPRPATESTAMLAHVAPGTSNAPTATQTAPAGVRVNTKKNIVAADASTPEWMNRLLATSELAGIPVTARLPADRSQSSGVVQGVDGDYTDEALLAAVSSDVPVIAARRQGTSLVLRFASPVPPTRVRLFRMVFEAAPAVRMDDRRRPPSQGRYIPSILGGRMRSRASKVSTTDEKEATTEPASPRASADSSKKSQKKVKQVFHYYFTRKSRRKSAGSPSRCSVVSGISAVSAMAPTVTVPPLVTLEGYPKDLVIRNPSRKANVRATASASAARHETGIESLDLEKGLGDLVTSSCEESATEPTKESSECKGRASSRSLKRSTERDAGAKGLSDSRLTPRKATSVIVEEDDANMRASDAFTAVRSAAADKMGAREKLDDGNRTTQAWESFWTPKTPGQFPLPAIDIWQTVPDHLGGTHHPREPPSADTADNATIDHTSRARKNPLSTFNADETYQTKPMAAQPERISGTADEAHLSETAARHFPSHDPFISSTPVDVFLKPQAGKEAPWPNFSVDAATHTTMNKPDIFSKFSPNEDVVESAREGLLSLSPHTLSGLRQIDTLTAKCSGIRPVNEEPLLTEPIRSCITADLNNIKDSAGVLSAIPRSEMLTARKDGADEQASTATHKSLDSNASAREKPPTSILEYSAENVVAKQEPSAFLRESSEGSAARVSSPKHGKGNGVTLDGEARPASTSDLIAGMPAQGTTLKEYQPPDTGYTDELNEKSQNVHSFSIFSKTFQREHADQVLMGISEESKLRSKVTNTLRPSIFQDTCTTALPIDILHGRPSGFARLRKRLDDGRPPSTQARPHVPGMKWKQKGYEDFRPSPEKQDRADVPKYAFESNRETGAVPEKRDSSTQAGGNFDETGPSVSTQTVHVSPPSQMEFSARESQQAELYRKDNDHQLSQKKVIPPWVIITCAAFLMAIAHYFGVKVGHGKLCN